MAANKVEEDVAKTETTKMQYLALFQYPMDESTRAEVFESRDEIVRACQLYPDIRALVVAFPVTEAFYWNPSFGLGHLGSGIEAPNKTE